MIETRPCFPQIHYCLKMNPITISRVHNKQTFTSTLTSPRFIRDVSLSTRLSPTRVRRTRQPSTTSNGHQSQHFLTLFSLMQVTFSNLTLAVARECIGEWVSNKGPTLPKVKALFPQPRFTHHHYKIHTLPSQPN